MKALLLVGLLLFSGIADARTYTHKEAVEGCTNLVGNLALEIINAAQNGAPRAAIKFKGVDNKLINDMDKFTDALYAGQEQSASKWLDQAVSDCATHMEQVVI